MRIGRGNSYDKLRAVVLERDESKCVECGSPEQLLVHHLSYDLFDERDVPTKFLTTLCSTCHARIPRRNRPYRDPPKSLATDPKGFNSPHSSQDKLVYHKMDVVIKPSDLLSIEAAAAAMGITTMTLWRWEQDGKLIAVKLGRYKFIPRSEVERLKMVRKDSP